MARNIKVNFLYNFLYQVTIVLLPLITIPYVSRVLRANGIGIDSLTKSNTEYFILFGTLGLSVYANKAIAQIRDNKENLKKTFWEIFIFQFIGCCISYIIFMLSLGKNNMYSNYYVLQGVSIISYSIDISWYFMGIEDFKKASLRSFFVKITSVLLIFALVNKPSDLNKYILINCITNLFGQLIMWKYVDRNILNIKNLKNVNVFKHFIPIFTLFIPQMAIKLYMVLDKTMLGVWSGATEVGYYDQSQKMIRVILSATTAIGMVILPRISNLFSTGKDIEAKEYLKKSFKFISFLSVPSCFGIIAISGNLIPVFWGEEFRRIILLTMLSSILIIIIGLGNVFGSQYLLAKSKNREYTISVSIGALFNVILNFILIPKFNSLGAVWATIISELIISMIQVFFAKTIFNIYWIKETLNYWGAAIFMFIAIIFMNKLLINTMILLIVQVLFGSGIYITILLLLKDKLIVENLIIIENKLKNNFIIRREK